MGVTALDPILAAVAADVIMIDAGRARAAGGEAFEVGGAGGPVAALTEVLYARHYCRPQPVAAPVGDDAGAFLETLRAANRVAARWETWTVAAADATGLTLLGAGGAQRRVGYHEAVAGAGGFASGQPVRVAAPRETLTTGHFAVFGRPVADAARSRQVRFYWNLEPAGAAPFLAAVTGRLDRRRIPFQAKVPSTPAGYGRADGGVLYLDAEDVPAALDLVAEVRAAVAAFLRPETPLFTRILAPGLAFAESPPGAESFGINRCRLLAEGLVAGFVAGEAPEAGMLARLLTYGIAPDAPERNPATAYPYPFEWLAA
jgi:hypothetical protein